MSYVKRVLLPDEQVLYGALVHWIVYLPTVLILCVSAVATLIGSNPEWLGLGPATAGLGGGFAAWLAKYLPLALLAAGGAISALSLIAFIPALIERFSTELVVTNQRVIAKTGFIRRTVSELNNDKIEGVDVDQSVAGRIFGYGTLTVRGTGGGTAPLNNIAKPIDFRNRVGQETAE